MKIKNLIENYNKNEYKKINHIALPLVLNNVLAMIIGLCDQAMVGRISLAAFGAVGLIASTINSITGVLGSISIGFNIIGARCKGEKRYDELKSNFGLNIFLNIFIGAVFFLGALKFGKIILETLYGFDGEELIDASEYLTIYSISIGLNMILFTYSSYFKIMNKTKYILYGNIIASISNVFFDYVFIFGYFGFQKMGIRGHAIGSILGIFLNIGVYLVVTRKSKLHTLSSNKIIKSLKETLMLSAPIMGQEFLESTLLVITINSILSFIGILEVSVYNLLLAVVNILLMPMYAYSQASLTIISESLGAKNLSKGKKTPLRCLVLAVSFFIMLIIVLLILKNYIPRIITDDTELINSSILYIPIALLINTFFIPATIYKLSLQGIDDGKWVFLASILINFMGVIFILFFTKIIYLGLTGVYIGMAINYIILAIAFYSRYNNIIKEKIYIN
ncbi:putative MATE family efflux protein [Clostridium saccharoperbutylacetonicum]|uniref:Probable multidrug resistance protein NorM n=1 Tax=Clostridium saccharoperbutylacetonicum N1-4(HMT) TaxID=931276 RepID=M1MEC3_9CLOT|nr:MATE family efflux transporter [Clostridium saccharoperbutylacetonicum]AGF56244.1 putative efflux protein, MATE family [Clostridium saccharoperbutylacetonicum N1-4(HMT)]NRT63013.1 putative MATE family efflux protein [Clostridium saccharoperbutylacetonicum]NSB26370.1 putative MATE family efflux protein [Clostridium saccharoperbutylacetonicum]NSB45723.1 putative MATE family efflux protein [Clostridium saccharoperbutylacetonicum]